MKLKFYPEDGSLVCLEQNDQQSECDGGTDVEARPLIVFGLYFCFSTEARKKETREDFK